MNKDYKTSATLLLAVVLTIALGFIMPKNKEKYLGDMFWIRKTFAPARYNVVLMGDSRVYRGVSPTIMNKQLPHLNILNFGFSNGGLNPTMFDAAFSKLNPHSKTKVIVMGVTANAVTGYTKNNEQYLTELRRPKEEVLENLYLNPLLYWFSSTTPQSLISKVEDSKDSSYYLSEYHMNGYVESDKFPVDTTESIPSYRNDFTKYKIQRENLEILFKQVKVWTAEGIIVIGYRPPVSRPMAELENTLGNYDEAFIQKGFQDAGGYWFDINPSAYKTYDGSHLDKPSVEKFSNDLAGEIKKLLASR